MGGLNYVLPRDGGLFRPVPELFLWREKKNTHSREFRVTMLVLSHDLRKITVQNENG